MLRANVFERLENLVLSERQVDNLFDNFPDDDEITFIANLDQDWILYLADLNHDEARALYEIFRQLQKLGCSKEQMDHLMRVFQNKTIVWMLKFLKKEWILEISNLPEKAAIELSNQRARFIIDKLSSEQVGTMEHLRRNYESSNFVD